VPPPSHLTSCTPTKSNLYWDLFLHCLERTCPIHTSNIPSTKSHIHFLLPRSFIQGVCPCPRLLVIFRNKLIFYGEELSAPRPTPKLEDHLLLAVHDCLFNIFAATLCICRLPPPSATWGRTMPWWKGTHLTWHCYATVVEPLLGGSPHTMEILLEVVFSMWSALKLYHRTEFVS
jgi:hypothetical protein